jgi:RND family efflux transporter MFP subunit
MNARILLVPVVFLAACSRQHDAAAAQPALPPIRVHLAAVRAENLPELIDITGTVRPVQRAQLAAKVMGTIDEMPITLGQHVRKGDLLIRINAAEISARVAQAQSQLNSARRDLDRERDLLGKGASTADMVRGLEDRLAAAQAMVREAEAMLSYTSIRAPFDGVVARKVANAGDLASPGLPLLELEGTKDFQVEAGVPDSVAARLKPGSDIAISLPATGATFVGRLAELSSAAESGTHTVLAKIAVPSDAFVRSGEFARVQVPGTPVAALTIPVSAVTRSGQMERVFVAEPGSGPTASRATLRAVLRLVKTGAARGNQIEILAGLDPNERVVVSPPAALREAQPLEMVP